MKKLVKHAFHTHRIFIFASTKKEEMPMKRYYCIIALVILSILPSYAQVEFGVRAGGAYSSLIQRVQDEYMSGGRFGWSIAGLMDVHLYKGLSFRPEVGFVNQGGSYYSQYNNPLTSEAHNKYSYYSIQVPLNLAYTFHITDIRLSVFAGPALDFFLFGKMRTHGTQPSTNIDFGSKEEPNLKSFDLGVNIGMSVEYSRFFFAINSVTGTLDRRSVKREGESNVFQNNVTFSLGYFFRKN